MLVCTCVVATGGIVRKYIFILLCILFPFVIYAATTDPETKKILQSGFDDLYRANSSYALIEMNVKTKYFNRSLEMETWSKGTKYTLIKIIKPKKEAGTATLKSGDNIWNYLPKIKKIIKLPSSMMSGNWMGSHLTNDDLVRESRFTDDFDCRIKSNTEKEIAITCYPVEDAVVTWGKVDLLFEKSSMLPMKIDYFDEDFALVRTMKFEDIKVFSGHKVPSKIIMLVTEKPDEYTEIIYRDLKFDIAIPDNTFSLRALKQ